MPEYAVSSQNHYAVYEGDASILWQANVLDASGIAAGNGEAELRTNLVSAIEGLVNYSAAECRRIAGKPSTAIESLLGYVDETELIHRNNLVLTG